MSDTSETLSAKSDPDQIWDDAVDDATFATQPWVPSPAFIRLRRFIEHECADRNEYALGRLPSSTGWGVGVYGSYLTLPHRTEEVANIWAIGHLASIIYAASESDSRPRFRIQLDLLRGLDRTRAADILNTSSPPTSNTLTELDFLTINKMSAPNRTGFRDIFDATTVYTKKASMQRLSITDIMVGDLVLAECTAVRLKTDDAPPHQWNKWQVGFQLHALSLLYRRSETVAPPPAFFVDDFEGTL